VKDKLEYQKASPAEVLAAQDRVALRDPDHLIQWLRQTNRRFVVFETQDLVKSLQDMEGFVGLQALQQLVNVYRAHRQTVPTGEVRMEKVKAPDGTTKEVSIPLMKDDTLTIPELDRCIRWLCAHMHDRNPGWSLDSAPL